MPTIRAPFDPIGSISMSRIVLLFASARDRAGRDRLAVDLGPGATVADLKAGLVAACPALGPLVPTLRIAIDAEYASDADPIPPGAELAAIPPVSGGQAGPSSPENR